MDKIGLDGVREELLKEGFSQESVASYLELFEKISGDTTGVAALGEILGDALENGVADGLRTIMSTVDAVKTADFRMLFDPTLVRGMSYYTGPIFEIAMDEFGGSVGGGGRYDEMIGKFTGNDTCACGFSIGFERIVMLLLERGYEVPGKENRKAWLVEKNMPEEKMTEILKEAMEERQKGNCVAISVMKKNKKDQLTSEGYTEIKEIYADR